jgi:lipid A ethanolaminephosphotransferase
MFSRFKLTVTREQLLLFTALWISLIPNWPTLKRFALAPDSGSGLTYVAFVTGGWLFAFTCILLFLLSVGALFWRSTIRYWYAFSLAVAAVLSHYTIAYGTLFNRDMVVNIAQTHPEEALELIGVRMILWVLLVGVVPAVVVLNATIRSHESRWKTPLLAVVLTVVPVLITCVFVFGNYRNYASAARNRSITFDTVPPVNLVAASIHLAGTQFARNAVREQRGLDARARYVLPKARLTILVVGETARAKNHSLNGYARLTNPKLANAGVVYFPDTESCGTSTAFSVPCMFSGLTRAEFSWKKARQQETLIDVIERSGASVIWRDNDSGCKDVCAAAEVIDFSGSDNPKWCTEKANCYDEILLDGLDERIKQLKGDSLIVLHLKGSHGPAYYKRYPPEFEVFKPACKSAELSACTQDAIVNAYDNTLVYTDHVLAQTIEILKRHTDRFATAMLYASDHGESLGENGMYLHGLPYAIAPKEQTQVPMLAWLSPEFLELERWSATCVQRQNKTQRSHDNIYHTVLGLLEIETREYNAKLDLFDECEKDAPQVPVAAGTR